MGGDRAHDLRFDSTRLTAQATLWAVALTLVPNSGCAQKHVEVWQPKPMVQWDHLSPQPIALPRQGYRIFPKAPSRGLFPASLAITRVTIERTPDPITPLRASLTTDPRNEFLQWNAALDDQLAVGEVFPIVEHDLGGGDADPEQILAAFKALRAGLGLTYAVNELSETETEMFGVLFDTVGGQPIAALHAQAVSVVPPEVVQESKEPIDLWETDSRALVRGRFEDLLRKCIHELIRRDKPATVVAPVGWTPAVPMKPVQWPPTSTGRTP